MRVYCSRPYKDAKKSYCTRETVPRSHGQCAARCVCCVCDLCERSRVGTLPTQWALSLRLSAYAEVHPRLRLLGGVGCILVQAGRWLRARVRAGQETKCEASGMGAGHRNCHLGVIALVLRCGSEAHRLDSLELAAAAGRRWCRAACAMVRSAARRVALQQTGSGRGLG